MPAATICIATACRIERAGGAPVNERRTPMDVSVDVVRQINIRHLITTRLAPADLLFVFGTREGVPEFLEAIVSLWKKGYFRHVLVSGGDMPGDDEAEAIVISRLMIKAGIPDDIILLESHATNTGENVTFSLPIIERQIGLANIRSLIALGKVCTSVRYLMTLERHWPEVRKMLCAVNYFDHPVAEWDRHPYARKRILAEWIEPYKAKGFIVDWPGQADRLPPE
jgi:uncharacterized SAM-binding protein YcdF (DUF218 family)